MAREVDETKSKKSASAQDHKQEMVQNSDHAQEADMSSDTAAPGKIPIDDMRIMKKYSEVLGADDDITSASPKDARRDKGDEEEHDFTTIDASEAISADQIPSRKHTLLSLDERLHTHPEGAEDLLSESYEDAKGDYVDDLDMESALGPNDFQNLVRHEDESQLRAQIHQLTQRLETASIEKQIAEEKAERSALRVEEMKTVLDADLNDVQKHALSVASESESLKEELKTAREQLNDAQSHIFSLQPYRKDLLAEEVAREYNDLLEGIEDWVEKFMKPWLDDPEAGIQEIMSSARKRTLEANYFKRTLGKYPDLVMASCYPETDADIVVALILRFINENIFQQVLYGLVQRQTEVISFLENSMQSNVQPKRDLFSVRNWTAEAYNGLLSAPEFSAPRQRKRKEMVVDLATGLKIFCPKTEMQWFYENMNANCILPAMKLYEKLLVSTHHFYLDVNPYIVWLTNGEARTSTEFLDSLHRLDCRNVLQHRKAFNIGRMDPPPTRKELQHRLTNICTVSPALYMRQIGQKDAIKEPSVVCKQKMLVAWGSEEKKDSFVRKGEKTLANHIYFSKLESQGWATPFLKWGGGS